MTVSHLRRPAPPARLAGLALAILFAVGTASAVAAPNPAPSPSPGQKPAAAAKPSPRGGPGEIGSSKEPIAIDADRLDVFDKEGRAVFAGNVVAVQGDTTMKCTVMHVFYESERGKGEKSASAGAPSGSFASDSNVKKIDCTGPVTITTKTQTATGDRAEFDRLANKVYILGNAALTDGPNVTRGERVVYDMTTSVANVEGGRVRALIVPGSDKDKEKDKDKETKRKTR